MYHLGQKLYRAYDDEMIEYRVIVVRQRSIEVSSKSSGGGFLLLSYVDKFYSISAEEAWKKELAYKISQWEKQSILVEEVSKKQQSLYDNCIAIEAKLASIQLEGGTP